MIYSSEENQAQRDKENQDYIKYVEKKTPNTKHMQNMLWAFLIGGAICVVGEGIKDILKIIIPNISKDDLSILVTVMMILIGAILTSTGVYGKLGSFAGAGSLVPITGFSNAVVASAVEFKTEGYIYGVSSKMFVIAGPIIVYGAISSMLVGLLYYFIYI